LLNSPDGNGILFCGRQNEVETATEKIQWTAGSRLLNYTNIKTSVFPLPTSRFFTIFVLSDVKKLWQSKKMFSRK
jgi:hypothetical protein